MKTPREYKAMKTYVFYHRSKEKTMSYNFKARNMQEALELSKITGYELVGELVEQIKLSEKEFEDRLKALQKDERQINDFEIVYEGNSWSVRKIKKG